MMINLKSTEKDTVIKLKGSNENALAQIYSLYAKKVYSLAVYIIKDHTWSEDVVQEVFIHLWEHRQILNEDKDIWLFLYIITKQKAITKLRAIMRHEVHKEKHWKSISESHNAVDEQVALMDLSNCLEIALNKLTPTQKQVFNLSRVEGLTHQEIAIRLSISINTVKNHMVAALKSLRTSLQQNQVKGLLLSINIDIFIDFL